MAPQAMVRNRQGKMGFLATKLSVPSQAGLAFRLLSDRLLHISGSAGIFIYNITIRATAINNSEKANRGYILPIILSMGSMVAMM